MHAKSFFGTKSKEYSTADEGLAGGGSSSADSCSCLMTTAGILLVAKVRGTLFHYYFKNGRKTHTAELNDLRLGRHRGRTMCGFLKLRLCFFAKNCETTL